jgi:glucokinase
MTSSTAPPGHHLSTTNLALALAGAVIGVGGGYGVAALVLEAPVHTLPTPSGEIDLTDNGSNPEGYVGTNREERGLMHRR